jgi:asparaginyl-tRNA synthetase
MYMDDSIFFQKIRAIADRYKDWNGYVPSPVYKPSSHVSDLANSKYFSALIAFRHVVKIACDYYWQNKQEALNVDLFMMTPSVSSPMGPGSDSEVISIKFGDLTTNLVDSSQFGFEPILLNHKIEKLYCYLPSMRGENPDPRHLNQFYHCEAEILGGFEILVPIIDNFIRFLAEVLLHTDCLLEILSPSPETSCNALQDILDMKNGFSRYSFDEVIDFLETNEGSQYINKTNEGRDITSKGEVAFAKNHSRYSPIWVMNFDRDRVPFYQKPLSYDSNKVINGDLIFPPLNNKSFGGEIVGAGQRQDNEAEIIESLRRQNVNSDPYKWYIDLRNYEHYSTTSGFGIGVERLIAWILIKDNIRDVIPYPRLKNVVTYP